VSMSTGGEYEARSSYSSALSASDSDSEFASDAEEVSDSELEWLENDLQEIMKCEGPESKTHNLFVVLQKSISEVRAITNKGKPARRTGRDSGLGSNSPPTGKNPPMKVMKSPVDNEKAFWRTKVAFSTLNDYRSSDDEDYESGDELPPMEKTRRRRRQSNVSTASITSSKASRRNRKSSVSEAGAKPNKEDLLPYWVRAISVPEEYDEQTGLFVPVDKFYNEDQDEDYDFPFLVTKELHEAGYLKPNYYYAESEEETEEEEDLDDEDDKEGKAVDKAEDKSEDKAEDKAEIEVPEQKAVAEVKDDLEAELKLLLEDAKKDLEDDLIEGKHRESGGPVQKSPEKIVVTKPDSEETAEVVEIEPPVPALPPLPAGATRKIWYQRDYMLFAENILGDNFASDVESDVDVEYVPPPVILEDELDYDEYDPEEVIEQSELTGLAEDLKVDLNLAANMVPIWVHVDSVKARKERAVAAAAEAERLRIEKEAALAAAQKAAAENEEAKKAAAAAAEKEGVVKEDLEKDPSLKKLSLAELEGAVQEIADGANNSVVKKLTRAKIEAETKESKEALDLKKSPKKSVGAES